jgi:hypothetical protein
MDILDVVTKQVIGELILALNCAAEKLSSGSISSQAGIMANLIRQGCLDYQQTNNQEQYCLIKFGLDTIEYWHQTKADKGKQSEAEVRIQWVQTDEQGQT